MSDVSGEAPEPAEEPAEAAQEPEQTPDEGDGEASGSAPGSGAPGAPVPPALDPSDSRTQLHDRLLSVLAGLPSFFEFDNTFAGINALDLHNLSTLLGASIEGQVVKALNLQRGIWDPDNEWIGYVFERQSQRFPDVRLARRNADGSVDIALGIELKGWFLLAKEGRPSFRFSTTPAACADHDLLVVVPWYLDNVLSGAPVAAEPFVVSARWAAEYRNYWWEFVRQSSDDQSIDSPAGAAPYPTSDARIADVPAYDNGGNFGRLARINDLMGEFIASANDTDVLGIRIGDWFSFLRQHTDTADLDEISERLRVTLKRITKKRSGADADAITTMVHNIGEILGK